MRIFLFPQSAGFLKKPSRGFVRPSFPLADLVHMRVFAWMLIFRQLVLLSPSAKWILLLSQVPRFFSPQPDTGLLSATSFRATFLRFCSHKLRIFSPFSLPLLTSIVLPISPFLSPSPPRYKLCASFFLLLVFLSERTLRGLVLIFFPSFISKSSLPRR